MKRVRITSTLNTTYDAIEAKRHNIWMGVSLGNKYFHKDHLARYISWAVSYSKEKFLMIVADELHSINYEVFEHMSPEKAMRKALRVGDRMCKDISEIVKELPEEEAHKAQIVRWHKIRQMPTYQVGLTKIENLAARDREFYQLLLDIVQINLGERAIGLSDAQMDTLARYVILEFPTFLGPLVYEGTVYDLNIYPGLSLLDDMVLAIQDKMFYRELTDDIPEDRRLAIAEVYAE